MDTDLFGELSGVRDWEAAAFLLCQAFVGILEFPWVRISAPFLPDAFLFKLQRTVCRSPFGGQKA